MIRILVAEVLKYRRSSTLWLVAGAPLVVVLLQVLNFWMRRDFFAAQNNLNWLFFQQNIHALWGMFLFPLMVVVLATLAAGIEHERNNWQYLLALPVSWGAIFAAKLLVTFGLMIISVLGLIVATLMGGWLIGLPDVAPVGALTLNALPVLVAALPLLLIHLWLAIRVKGFAFCVGAGIVGVITGLFAISAGVVYLHPWAYPLYVLNASGDVPRSSILLIALVASSLLGLVAGQDFVRRDAPQT